MSETWIGMGVAIENPDVEMALIMKLLCNEDSTTKADFVGMMELQPEFHDEHGVVKFLYSPITDVVFILSDPVPIGDEDVFSTVDGDTTTLSHVMGDIGVDSTVKAEFMYIALP